MGCDIHIYTEKKTDDKWLCCDFYTINDYYDPNDKDDWEQEYSHAEFYKGRYYELFGALAGVRHNNILHIPPRGFPDNTSKQCSDDYVRWGNDAHTPSWLTLSDLKEQQKALGNTIKRSGMISPVQHKELEAGKKPDIWCGWTSQEDWIQAEWEDEGNPLNDFMEQLNKFLESRFYKHELDQMDNKDFRIVFWFDN